MNALVSSATAVIGQLIDEPGSATTRLASDLPKSSNFYISYLLLQGLSIAGGTLLQIVDLILFYLLGRIFDDTPRKLWTRWSMLGGLGWGTVFPIYTNLAVIATTYSLLSPLILVFAASAFGLLYFAYLHNFLYVYDQRIDTGGMIFPRAIWQSFTGIYLLEVFMTGLFGIVGAYPQLVLFVITIPITILYQILLQWKIERSFGILDNDCEDMVWRSPISEKPSPILGIRSPIGKRSEVSVPVSHPGVQQSAQIHTIIVTDNFQHPAVTAVVKTIWIPQDSLGISEEEINDTKAAGDIKITDEGARLDERNKLVWVDGPPDHEP